MRLTNDCSPVCAAVSPVLHLGEVSGRVLSPLVVVSLAGKAGGVSFVAKLPRHGVPHLSKDV